jgi:RNase P/RNase MRP subunit POP5
MPVHRIRKRYLLLRWRRDDPPLIRSDFERFLDSFNDKDEGANQLNRLMILDSRACLCIIRTRHTMVSKLKTRLAEESERHNLHAFQVVAVSGTMKKLKVRLFASNPDSCNSQLKNA